MWDPPWSRISGLQDHVSTPILTRILREPLTGMSLFHYETVHSTNFITFNLRSARQTYCQVVPLGIHLSPSLRKLICFLLEVVELARLSLSYIAFLVPPIARARESHSVALRPLDLHSIPWHSRSIMLRSGQPILIAPFSTGDPRDQSL